MFICGVSLICHVFVICPSLQEEEIKEAKEEQ